MGRHAADTRPSRPVGLIALVAAVLVGALVAGGIALARRDSGTPSSASGALSAATIASATCAGTTTDVTVAVAPAAVDVVKAAATRTLSTDPCLVFTVTPSESADVASTLTASGAKPDAWVSDSSVFLGVVRGATPDVLASDVRPLATSPLVFAVPAGAAAAAKSAGTALAAPSWASLLTADPSQSALPLRLPDPEHSTSGRLLLLTASAAIPSTPETRIALGRVLLSWSHTAMRSDPDLLAAATGGEPGIVPTSEQAVSGSLTTHPGSLVAVVPAEGTARYDYALTTRTGVGADVAQAVTRLGDRLTDAVGAAAWTAAGFRLPDDSRGGTPAVPGMPTSTLTYLPAPSVTQQAGLMRTWTSVKTDARMLALVDTSGSMRQVEGTRTRIQLAGEAAQTAVSIFPGTTQVGLWTFALDKGGGGQDWQEAVPIRQLDATVADAGGRPQRQVLSDALPALVGSVGGGTGLYDTLLAAYERMVSSYEPGRVNSVILLTDGRNEDPTGLTLEQLLDRISAVKDPAKPVVIITVGMGQGVDTAALSAVAAVTGGKSYVAQDPQDIKQVFIDALLSRDCTGLTCTTR